MRVTVNVTEKHITEGRCGGPNCAVELAVLDILGVNAADCGYRFIHLDRETDRKRTATLPYEATQWIKAFDNKQPVQPFSFELDIPEVA